MGAAGAYGSAQGVRDLLGGLLATVHVAPPSAQEQLAILAAAHPALAGSPLLPAGLAAAALVRRAAGQEPPGSLGTSEVRLTSACLLSFEGMERIYLKSIRSRLE